MSEENANKRVEEGESDSPPDKVRRQLLKAGTGALLAVSAALIPEQPAIAAALDISNRFSPKNRRRPRRPYTRYLVLHTTEGGETSSLRKLRKRGEAHYLVNRRGKVYRIIDKNKIATHAGRSMWEGRRNVDNYSIGVEVVGYHNKELTSRQYTALRELIRQLQSLYKIPDKNVVTHSMVAYGRPNRFHRSNHRGRKRCAMILARHDVRARLGLTEKPLRDRDVEAGRLKVADPDLHRYLYAPQPRPASGGGRRGIPQAPDESNLISSKRSAWLIAREAYNSPQTVYIFPDGSQKKGNQIKNWGRIPAGTRVVIQRGEESQGQFEGFREVSQAATPASELAGDDYAAATTIYFLPNGMVRTGRELQRNTSGRRTLDGLPDGTRVLVGYIYGGHVKGRRLPAQIAGIKWNYPSTFYRFPGGRILSGDAVDARSIPQGTLIFYQN